MSWISDLAGKAENALMKFDSKAAVMINENTDRLNKSQHTKKDYQQENSSEYHLPSSSSVPKNLGCLSSDIVDLQAPSSLSGSFHESSSFTSSPKKFQNKSNSTDKSLINFLNEGPNKSNEVDPDSNLASGNENVSIGLFHSRQSSGSSFLDVGGRVTPIFTSLDTESSTGSAGSVSSDPYVTIECASDLTTSQETAHDGTLKSSSKKRSEDLQASSAQETVFLRKEVSSLNQEMMQMLKRAKETEKESLRMKDQLSKLNLQLKQSERLLRDMQENETKLQKLGKEKDEMVYSLQLKVQEATQKIKEREKSNKELHEQNQRLLDGANVSKNIHSELEISLQEKLNDTELKHKQETDLLNLAREEATNRIIQLEEDQKTMSRDLSDLNRKLLDERTKSASYNSQIINLKSDLTLARNDLEDYKTKASRILQSKDVLIASLKGADSKVDLANDQFLKEEMDQIKNERDLLREELVRSSSRIQILTGEATEAEAIAQQEAQNTLHQLSQVQEDLERERAEATIAHDELKQAKQELRCFQEELTRQKVNISSRLNERDEEIRKLQKQIAHKQSSSSSITELENRIHGLTESLILKQTNIESLSTDKHSLQIQLEKMQQQYQESQTMLNKDSVIEFNQDEVRNRAVPSFLLESPFDGGVTRRVKKAYGTLDKFSIRLGIFLRRYPIARVFVLIYMGLLHAWVMIVLLTYTPEIHGSEYPHPVNLGTAPRVPQE